jgi:hypothetical protein
MRWFASGLLVVSLFNASVEAVTGLCHIPSWCLHLELAALWLYVAVTEKARATEPTSHPSR